jgi:hypothetical protein
VLSFDDLYRHESKPTGVTILQNDEWIKNYEKDGILSKKWPSEDIRMQKESEHTLQITVQNNITNEIASVGESDKLVAKSYINDPNVYLYDKKNSIQLFSFFGISTGRDWGKTPIHLSFSKDGSYLYYTTGIMGFNGGSLEGYYVLNLKTLNIIDGQFRSPIFSKLNDGGIKLENQVEHDYSESNNYQKRLSQWGKLINSLKEHYYNYDNKDDLIQRLTKEDFLEKDSHFNIDNADAYINAEVPGKFDICWPELFTTNKCAFVNLESVSFGFNKKIVQPSTSRKRTPNSDFGEGDRQYELDNLSIWPYLLGVKFIHNNKSFDSYLHVVDVYSSDKLKIYAFERERLGQLGSTFAIFDTRSQQPIALPEVSGIERAMSYPKNYVPRSDSRKRVPLILPQKLYDCYQERFHYLDNQKSQFWLSSDLFGLISIDLNNNYKVSQYNKIPPFQFFAVSGDYLLGVSNRKVPKMELYSIEDQSKILDFYPGAQGSYVMVTDEGYYMGKMVGRPLVAFKVGLRGLPFEQFDLRLNRPDIVLNRLEAPKDAIEAAKSLRDKRLKRMGVTEKMLKPDFHIPELQIAGDVPATTSKDQLDLKIKAIDDKYPLDRLRVYVNNVPVNGRDGELLRDQKTQTLEKTIPIKLAAGRNKTQVSVLNSAGAESLYANAEVNCTAERPKPKLYAVAMGVSQYDRPEWCLKYAAKDASDLIVKLKAKAGSAYSEVKPLLLTDKEVTKESAVKIKEFLSGATIDDTVLIFMAGHGLLDDKYDYYFGTTDIDPAKPSERGMPYEAIDTILAEVPSLKKALLMDTCHAGELDDDEKKDLAASDGSATPAAIPAAVTNSSPLAGKVAMRSIGTRGMQVKAVEGAKGKSDWYEKLQDMFVDLRRGSGATVISSSQGAEYALESSEQSNGLFTYALMEALDGKATPNKDGQITISSIGDYVKKRVQDLTKGKQNPNLRGVNLEEDFTLASKK